MSSLAPGDPTEGLSRVQEVAGRNPARFFRAHRKANILQVPHCWANSSPVSGEALPQGNTLSFPARFVPSFTQLIREVFKDLDFKPLN